MQYARIIYFTGKQEAPARLVPARGTAHKELLMDGLSVTREAHHAVPRCLISLHEKANGTSLDGEGIQAWLEWEWEAMRWRVPVEISRSDLEVLVDQNTV